MVMEVLAGGISEHQAGLCLERGIVEKSWSSLTTSPSSLSFLYGISSPSQLFPHEFPHELSTTSTLLSPGASDDFLRGCLEGRCTALGQEGQPPAHLFASKPPTELVLAPRWLLALLGLPLPGTSTLQEHLYLMEKMSLGSLLVSRCLRMCELCTW